MCRPMRVSLSIIALATVCCSSLGVALAAAQARMVPMTDPSVRLVGRWAMDKEAATSAWSGSAIEFRIENASEIAIRARTSNADRVQVEIDGAPASAIAIRKGSDPERYVVASGLGNGPHVVRLIKCTEPIWGNLTVSGIELSPPTATLSRVERISGRQIEIIGDSISAGYGNEAASEKERFSAATQNAYLTYGAIAARELNADYQCIAWSGRKMWPDYTVPEVYGRVLPFDPGSKYQFAGWRPQVVVVCLGTNDFNKGAPEKDGWTAAYADFIARLRERYGKEALMYVATSPMVSETWPKPDSKHRTKLRGYLDQVISLRAASGDTRVKLLEFAQQEHADGLGADWHPSVNTHSKMAKVLVSAIRSDLGWKPNVEPTTMPASEGVDASAEEPSAPDGISQPGELDRPVPPGKPTDPAWGCYPNNKTPYTWMDLHRGYVERAKQGDVDLLFLGDSLTEFWAREGKAEWATHFAKHKAANFGRGGDTTRQILWRIDHGELDGISPKLVVLMIGTNNLSRPEDSEDEIAAGVKACIDRIRAKAPAARVLLLSVPPRWGFDKKIPILNKKIEALADGTTVRYLDVSAPLATATFDTNLVMYTNDRVHLSAEGYRAMAGLLAPAVEELLK